VPGRDEDLLPPEIELPEIEFAASLAITMGRSMAFAPPPPLFAEVAAILTCGSGRDLDTEEERWRGRKVKRGRERKRERKREEKRERKRDRKREKWERGGRGGGVFRTLHPSCSHVVATNLAACQQESVYARSLEIEGILTKARKASSSAISSPPLMSSWPQAEPSFTAESSPTIDDASQSGTDESSLPLSAYGLVIRF
jgi:hypothetical protein